MEYKDLTEKNATELQSLLKEKRESLRTFRFGVMGSNSRNVKEGRTLRKHIARILTAITSRGKTS